MAPRRDTRVVRLLLDPAAMPERAGGGAESDNLAPAVEGSARKGMGSHDAYDVDSASQRRFVGQHTRRMHQN